MKTVKYLLLLTIPVVLLLSFNFFESDTNRKVYKPLEGNTNWLKVVSSSNITEHDVIEVYKPQLGLSERDKLVLKKEHFDAIGNKHSRYQHFYKNILVKGSEVYVHSKNGKVHLVNHTLVKNLNVNPEVIVQKDEAFGIAKSRVSAEKYMWESQWAERLIKRITKNPEATNFPTRKLVLFAKDYSKNPNNYKLCYDIMIHSMIPEKKVQIFINAITGEIVQEINDLHTGKSKGVAETKYHGTRDIITDSISADSFRLIDTVRGAGVETYNAERKTNLEFAVDFYDDDNYWNNVNQFQDEVATDAHYGAESTFDFYLEKLGREGLNGDTLPFIGFVHVDQDWTNATWNGMFARFGDGGGNDQPLTALDVVAHEYTHGLTDFTADLVYMNEPGALNESYSDILGSAVEFYADSATGDWLIGEDFIATGGFRSMSEPNTKGDPDTYLGQLWKTGSGDNGGVHSNSGVQNYWFYLMTEGDSGINDNGDYFEVEGLGLDSAVYIAYWNLSNYLLETSQYIDARIGGIQSAIDIYGDCTNQVIQTTNAWHAVGVGELFPRNDIELIEITGPDEFACGVSENENLSVLLTFHDCGKSLLPGTKIPLNYSVNNGDFTYDTLELNQEVFPNDTFEFVFNNTIEEFSSPGVYEINVAVDFPNDNRANNNSDRQSFERIYAQNVDMELLEVLSPISACFMQDTNVVVNLKFKGCDSIVSGEMMTLKYRVNNGEYSSESFILDTKLYRDDTLKVTLSDQLDFSQNQEYIFDAILEYEDDTVYYNNELLGSIIDNPIPLQFNVEMTFETENNLSFDSLYIFKGTETTVEIKDSVGFKDTKGIAVTGKDGLNQILDNRIEVPEFENIWTTNPEYKSQKCFCADLTNYNFARLKFRINQTFSPIYDDFTGGTKKYASAMRLMLNGEQYGGTFTANNYENNPYYLNNLEISDYTGSQLEICFETSTLTSKEIDPYGIGDNVYLDEIILLAEQLVSTNEVENLEVSLYPNPVVNELIIESDNVNFDSSEIEVYSVNGNQVYVDNKILSSTRTSLNTSRLSSGIYFVKVYNENYSFTRKFIVQ